MRTFKALNPLSLIAVFLLALPLGYAQSALGQDVDSVTFDSQSQTLTYYPSQSAASCRADCQNNPLCAAYSWVKPGGYTVGDPPVCYLIATVGPLVQSPCCISAVKGGTPPVAGSQTFSNPTSQGYRVDRCLYWAQQCDEPAATAWCSTQGYARATNWQWVYVKPTLVLGDGSVCDTDDCGGFSSITCTSAVSTAGDTKLWDWATRGIGEQRGQVGLRLSFICPANGSPGAVLGTDIYTDDSGICPAAVHAGVISLEQGGTVTIELLGAQQSYTGSTRNGITSVDFGPWPLAFRFVQ